MGITRFFGFFKARFSENITNMAKGQTFADVKITVDNLMIDMNGVFHNSAQKIYEYGNFKPPQRLMARPKQRKHINHRKQQDLLFQDVCKTVEDIFHLVNPKKRLILCVDGPAPLAKQQQQRQRRFRSAKERDENSPFDTCSITPGTKFMDYLTKYIDWYIRKRISEDEKWQSIEVIFSNEKAPGEGEHSIINYIRYYGEQDDSYCIHGLDADLIMLALATHRPKFYILREDLYDKSNEFFAINIGEVRKQLVEVMRWEGAEFNPEFAVNDFVFLCFMVGNDFLPHIPSIEIIEGGIDVMIDVYKNVCEGYGHITKKINNNIVFVKRPMEAFLGTISQYEKGMLEEKMNRKDSYFPDLLLEKHSEFVKDTYQIDIGEYREEYFSQHFPSEVTEEYICHQYLEGMQWVLSYYTRGVPNWKWYFPYHYSPFAHNLVKHIQSFRFPHYGRTTPNSPYQQLLSVLPPKSANLLPEPLCSLLTDESSPLKPYCPDNFAVDISGKKQEWEGISLVPFVDQDIVNKAYFNYLDKVDRRDLRRNITGRSFVYSYSRETTFEFNSYYGNISDCKVRTSIIDL